MNLKTVLTPETVNLHLKGTSKEEIIDELLEMLVQAGKVKDKAVARACVLDRERKMSTGMKHGIAIPCFIPVDILRSRSNTQARATALSFTFPA